MVIGDARTPTFATSQPAPEAPRPKLIGILNGPIRWGDRMWAAVSWDTIANWPAPTRGEALLHESFHVVQQTQGIGAADPARLGPDARSENEHLDTADGRYWLRLDGARSPGRCGNPVTRASGPPPTRWRSGRRGRRGSPSTSSANTPST
jgi:hypothetical protein